MFSDKIADKLLKLDSSKNLIRESARDEVDKLIRSAQDGDKSALEAIASMVPQGANLESVLDLNTFQIGLTDKYIELTQGDSVRSAAKKKKKSKLREVEERILQFCVKPRVSSSVIGLFPARPFNILAVMENLKHKGMLLLASNHWVTNVENRDFVPTMTIIAEKKGAQFESKTAEMWAYSDVESKKRLLARAKIKAADQYASEPWDFLPNWVKKSVAYVHENPATAIAEKKTAEEYCANCGHGKGSHKREDDQYKCDVGTCMCEHYKKPKKEATGEADQDYDHEFFDKIVEQLDSAGFPGAEHREFDKYQGVYLKVPGVDKFWIKEVFYSGKKSPGSRPHGDFTYEEGTETEHVLFTPEKSDPDEDIEIEVTGHGGDVDASQLIEYAKHVKGGKESSKKIGYARKDYIQFAELVRFLPDTITKDALIDGLVNLFKGDNPNFDSGRFKEAIEKKKAETGEVKKDVPMEITQIQDIETGEKMTDPKLITEGISAGLDYIVSFKREGKEVKALLSSLDKSELKVAIDGKAPMLSEYSEQLHKLSDALQFALKDFKNIERDMGTEYFIVVAKLSASREHLQLAIESFELAMSGSSVGKR